MIKKIAVFILVFLFLTGISIVDDSHSFMTGKEAELSLQTRRIDSDIVKFSMLGIEKEANMAEVSRSFRKTQKEIVSAINGAAESIRDWLGFSEWPRKDFTFESKVL